MFHTIDRLIIVLIERIAQSLQRTFGIHPMTIAAAGNALFAISNIVEWYIPDARSTPVSKGFDAFLLFTNFVNAAFVIPRIRKEVDEGIMRGYSNEAKNDKAFFALRMFILSFMVLNTAQLLGGVTPLTTFRFFEAFGMFISAYFMSCDPLPPGPSRFRKWIEGSFGKRALARN